MKINEETLKLKFLSEYKNNGNFTQYLTEQRIEEYGYRYSNLLFLKEDKEEELKGNEERNEVIKKIENNDFIINDNEAFKKAILKGKRGGFLTNYDSDEYKNNFKTFKLNGYDIGYAIKNDGDIVSVFNNSKVRNIGEYLLLSAIKNGGNKLDHFDGFLSKFYENLGFKEYDRDKWNDEYRPANWDEEKYGRPNIVYRKLEKNN